ncbi:hypothetical protein CBR_g41453 [Chara braunii]|uniref:Sucrose transporter n=1 Tax=Chara braunii TaxID=69332 RepID=A0A388LVV9_CHABU|nr:hypothetical protein CBR_g41453 [Chara braunii]|eukprot:GBG86458.1 hypothetical protein CBR_g41453 [Chara braunii]
MDNEKSCGVGSQKCGESVGGGGGGWSGGASAAGDRVKSDLKLLGKVSMVAAGIQFGWALQLSLLTPYIQELGIPHQYASFIWLCGPISGLLVQPVVGVWSDECGSRWGRRRPFIAVGALLVALSVLVIGYSADLGHLFGDNPRPGDLSRPRACIIFVIGFWLLDLANNTVQGPSRALLADLAGKDPRRVRAGNAFFSAWIAFGQILGYSTGSYGGWYKIFPFTKTEACGEACANLKAAFGLAVVFLTLCTIVTIVSAKEIARTRRPAAATAEGKKSAEKESEAKRQSGSDGRGRETLNSGGKNGDGASLTTPLLQDSRQQQQEEEDAKEEEEESRRREGSGHCSSENDGAQHVNLVLQVGGQEKPAAAAVKLSAEGGRKVHVAEEEEEKSDLSVGDLFVIVRHLPCQIWFVLAVTALTWLAWFPFLLFDTDWMGREVYSGSPTDGHVASLLYDMGVHMGAVGLLLNSVVLGLFSLAIEPLCRKFLSRRVWTAGNVLLCLCMGATYVVTRAAKEPIALDESGNPTGPQMWVKVTAVVIFALLGIPLAITFSVPYSMMAVHTTSMGGGQGLAMGVLNLAVVIPQMVVSCLSGPWDEFFGGGNEPAFFAAGIFALAGAVVGGLVLPNPPPSPEQKSRGKKRSNSFLTLSVV